MQRVDLTHWGVANRYGGAGSRQAELEPFRLPARPDDLRRDHLALWPAWLAFFYGRRLVGRSGQDGCAARNMESADFSLNFSTNRS